MQVTFEHCISLQIRGKVRLFGGPQSLAVLKFCSKGTQKKQKAQSEESPDRLNTKTIKPTMTKKKPKWSQRNDQITRTEKY